MTGPMRISPAGLQLIKSFEGFRETAVRLPDGRWTIGYGHVRTAREGLTISPKDADELLLHDLKSIENAVSNMIYAPLMQGQFDALVSLAFNISLGQLRDSDIVRLLNSGDYLGAANAFDLWRKARLHGRVIVVDALVRRRAAEKTLFLQHPSGPPSAPTPMVTPEMDFGTGEPPQRPRTNPIPPRANDDEEPETPRSGPAPSGEIAEAVRRLAEKTQNAIWPSIEIPLPPGASIATPEGPATYAPVEEALPMAYEAPTETMSEAPQVVEDAPEADMPRTETIAPEPPVTAEDLARAEDLKPEFANDAAALYVLPDAAWSRRVNGVFSNRLAQAEPQRAYAVLVTRADGYVVSVRAPRSNPVGAETLCSVFATGGGRQAAAGINLLPQQDLPRFADAFRAAYK